MGKGTAEIKKVLGGIIKEIFPDLNGFQYPIKAKVVKLYESGGRVEEFRKRYSVDVQPLKADGSVDEEKPVIPDVPLDVSWAGENRGILSLPPKGAIVRIGFYYWNPSLPYVDGVIGDGYPVPEHPDGSLVIQQRDGVLIKIHPNGRMEIKTDQEIKMTAKNSVLTLEPGGSAKIETTTDIQLTTGAAQMTLKSSGDIDVANGAIGISAAGVISLANGGPAIARVGDRVSCPCGTGTIASGSSRANCGG